MSNLFNDSLTGVIFAGTNRNTDFSDIKSETPLIVFREWLERFDESLPFKHPCDPSQICYFCCGDPCPHDSNISKI